jgi:hypothetical protein
VLQLLAQRIGALGQRLGRGECRGHRIGGSELPR